MHNPEVEKSREIIGQRTYEIHAGVLELARALKSMGELEETKDNTLTFKRPPTSDSPLAAQHAPEVENLHVQRLRQEIEDQYAQEAA